MHYGLSPKCLEVISDVQAWCLANGLAEENSSRAAKCFFSPTECHIVMRDEQTDAMISSAKGAMLYRGFEDELASLDSDRTYLIHLMLHEVACFTLQTAEQEPRDEWAFRELGEHVA